MILGIVFTVAGTLILAFIAMLVLGMFLLSRSPKQLTMNERNRLRADLGVKKNVAGWKPQI